MRETYNNVGKDVYNFVKMGKNDFTKICIFLQFMACSITLVQPNRMHDKTSHKKLSKSERGYEKRNKKND